MCVTLHLDLLVHAVRQCCGVGACACAGQLRAARAMHHGEVVAGLRRPSHTSLDVAVRRPAHQAIVEVAVLDDPAFVERSHRIAEALQIQPNTKLWKEYFSRVV